MASNAWESPDGRCPHAIPVSDDRTSPRRRLRHVTTSLG
ncbi:hypothetical protein HMPREF9206_2288 [Cutibacterium acnes J139]|nr:hypothetical protein HMPREF9206_2288 [Cutibacterium acnes J139]